MRGDVERAGARRGVAEMTGEMAGVSPLPRSERTRGGESCRPIVPARPRGRSCRSKFSAGGRSGLGFDFDRAGGPPTGFVLDSERRPAGPDRTFGWRATQHLCCLLEGGRRRVPSSLGSRADGSRVQAPRVQVLGFRRLGFRTSGLGTRVQGLGFRNSGSGASGLGPRVV